MKPKKNLKNVEKKLNDLMFGASVISNLHYVPNGEYICFGLGSLHFFDPANFKNKELEKQVVILLNTETGKDGFSSKPILVLLEKDPFKHKIPFHSELIIKIKKRKNYKVVTLSRKKDSVHNFLQTVNLPPTGDIVGWDDELVYHVWITKNKLVLWDGKTV